MKESVESSIKIAVLLLIIGFGVFIVLTVVNIGQEYARGEFNRIDSAFAESVGNELETIANHPYPLPAAATFIAARKHSGHIEGISGQAFGVTITKIDDLKKLLRYDIRVTVLKNEDLGTYRLVVNE